MTRYGLVDHGTSLVNIDLPNPFQLVLSTIMNVENEVIDDIKR